MEMSVREAKARFAEAAAAAARGERVTVTRYGKPFIEMVPARAAVVGDLFERLARVRAELHLADVDIDLPADFDDPAFSRRVLGLDE